LAIRVRLQLFRRARDLALFDLGIDSKLRACDLVGLKVRDICHGERVAARAIVMQQKTARPVQFEVTESIREVVAAWIKEAGLPGSRKSGLILLTTGHTRCAA
jgi:site-specific recombinase XerC